MHDRPPVPQDPVPAAPDTPRPRSGPEEAIPMLTEIVEVSRSAVDEPSDPPIEDDWDELAARVREHVTERLAERSRPLIEAALRDSLRQVAERAARVLADELRDALERTVRDAVARAVDEELARLRDGIAGRDDR
jgi:uncharacterized membrane-anchored protein YjiN (DUF445 family)